MTCPTPEEMVEERIDRVLTQYRESPKLLHVLRTYLHAVAASHLQVCDLPERFNLDTATGHQLTLIGKRMGWPRCHCVCSVEPVFGFECEEVNLRPVSGFCEDGTPWAECATGIGELCINDDESYRAFLRVRAFQMTGRFDLASLEQSLRIFFGSSARVMYSGQGRVVVAPGRRLSQAEQLLLQLYPRVMPVALGIRVLFHFGEEPRVFGFGEGWGGFLEEDPEATAATDAFHRTGKLFGFCEDDDMVGGFCEVWSEEGLPLKRSEVNEYGEPIWIVDEDNNHIYTGPLTSPAAWVCRTSAPWMCETDVHPYDCQ